MPDFVVIDSVRGVSAPLAVGAPLDCVRALLPHLTLDELTELKMHGISRVQREVKAREIEQAAKRGQHEANREAADIYSLVPETGKE